jgi:hypothetical protein
MTNPNRNDLHVPRLASYSKGPTSEDPPFTHDEKLSASAAYWHDIADEPGTAAAFPGKTTDRIRHGRVLWASIGGWPWCLFPDGDLPNNWHQNPQVVEAWQHWIDHGH